VIAHDIVRDVGDGAPRRDRDIVRRAQRRAARHGESPESGSEHRGRGLQETETGHLVRLMGPGLRAHGGRARCRG